MKEAMLAFIQKYTNPFIYEVAVGYLVEWNKYRNVASFWEAMKKIFIEQEIEDLRYDIAVHGIQHSELYPRIPRKWRNTESLHLDDPTLECETLLAAQCGEDAATYICEVLREKKQFGPKEAYWLLGEYAWYQAWAEVSERCMFTVSGYESGYEELDAFWEEEVCRAYFRIRAVLLLNPSVPEGDHRAQYEEKQAQKLAKAIAWLNTHIRSVQAEWEEVLF